jgi:hypothetical protein
VQWILTGLAVVLPGWFALLAARIVCSYGPKRYASPESPCFIVYDKMEALVFLGAQLHGKPSESDDSHWVGRFKRKARAQPYHSEPN